MKPRIGLIAVAILALAGVATMGAACGDNVTQVQPQGQQQTGITVSGEGKATGTPDVANIQLGVSTLADTVANARSQAATAMDAMINSIKANGVDEKDIQTQQLSINPEYDYTNNKPVLRGFRVTNVVSAKIRKIDDTSKIVDDAVAAGGNDTQVQGISFTIDEPDSLLEQARQEAVANARAKAETLAKEAGVKVGKVTSISETNAVAPVPYPELGGARSAAGDTATPIEPGTQDVTVSVNVTFEIE